MFIELWRGLLDYYHDNTSTADINNAKLFINWSIEDIANIYNWPFLRGTMDLSVSADGLYSLNKFNQLSASANVYAIAQTSADNGVIVQCHGKYVSGNVYYNTVNDLNCSAGVTASASNFFNSIDHFCKPITTGSIVITTGSTILCTLGATDTCISNDVRKITAIADASGNRNAQEFDYNDQLLANPDGSTDGSVGGYDIDYNNQIRFFNIDSARTYSIVYQRNPKYLSANTDLTEFPRWFYQDIINYTHKVYGLRFQDENDAWNGISMKPMLLQDIVAKHTNMTNNSPRVMPAWVKRRV